ncbi:RNA-directed DNA polymerase, eukaryota, reverse transcriptase zinc-binding domain protein, partial [Tanacetum coccineum]
ANNTANKHHDFKGVFGSKLNNEEALNMVKEVIDNEIKNAMFDIGDNTAPHPDGYTSTLFKKILKIVGDDVCLAIREFFMTRKLLGGMNATLISLIPKVSTPNKVSDYRPIACCNVIYKCISKIITDRIKLTLHKLINLNQSAFIQGRVIQENILITHELLKVYDRKSNPSRCCMKIDIAKAYDIMDWNFHEKAITNFGFHERMVKWIMVCVSTAKFTINLNCERKGYFASGRGIRQGYIMFYMGCKELKLTQLCFADDLLVVSHGDVESVRIIRDTMMEFSNISGLIPNMEKSTIQLIYIVKNRVDDWKNKYLSYAGRLQLIASVLSSLNVYWAAVFRIPKTIVKDIDKILKGFL